MTAILAPSRTPLKLGMYGKDVQAWRIVANEILGRPAPSSPEWYQRTFNLNARQLAKDLADDLGLPKFGVVWPAMMDEIRDADQADGGRLVSPKADALFAQAFVMYSKPKRKVPPLGPIWRGGQSILLHDLTHMTSNMPEGDIYPAYDDAFDVGVEIIAPEALEVTRDSSANPGDAFYATGDSGIRYWFGHLDRAPRRGSRFKKGGVLGRVAPNHLGGGPHAHIGIDAQPLCGFILKHRTDYRHGAPLVGVQLRAWALAA